MNFVSRSDWGAPPTQTSTNITPVGVLVHWVGPSMGTPNHGDCADRVRGIRSYHINGNGWADIAYSALVCPHGYVFEGRGKGRRTAANGTNDGNQRFYAVCYLGGQGDDFTDDAKNGINDAIDWLGGGEVGGHRDATSTSCPGGVIYSWVEAGHPRAGDTPEPHDTPCEEKVFGLGDEDRCVIYIQRLLNKRGNTLVDDGDFGPRTERAVKRFQLRVGLNQDGVVGPRTWTELWKGITL